MPKRWKRRERIDGILYIECLGPLHGEGTMLPSSYFSPKKSDGPNSYHYWCKRCRAHRRGYANVHVFAHRYQWIFVELVSRLGVMETSRRTGIPVATVSDAWTGKRRHMKDGNVKRAIATLKEVRAAGEVRHKDSITRGAAARGEEEKTPTRDSDYYISTSDDEREKDRRRKRERRENGEGS